MSDNLFDSRVTLHRHSISSTHIGKQCSTITVQPQYNRSTTAVQHSTTSDTPGCRIIWINSIKKGYQQ